MNDQTDQGDTRYNFLAQHLVALEGSYEYLGSDKRPTGSFGHFLYSGFVMSLRGQWLLVTAGHILQDLQERLEKRQVELLSCYLIDYFGPNAKSHSPIPFTFKAAPNFHVHDEDMGLDFGLIRLSGYYQGLLEKNRIVPFTERDWAPSETLFNFYMMIGIPESFIDVKPDETHFDVVFRAAIVAVSPENDPPESMQRKFPRFVGRLGNIAPLETMRGMSGAPILGFAKENNGYRYRVVAIQSSWLKPDLIAGCPVGIFINWLEGMPDSTE